MNSGNGNGVELDPHLGMAFGDYVITRKLAEGGMGAVYVAEHRGMKKIVKFMLAPFAANAELRRRFQRECDAAIKLRGKTNIVDIDSHSERNGELYLVMEFLDGETLGDHVRRRCGRIAPRHAFRLVAQIIAALHELHTAGIIHRDLKPDNVFVVATDEEPYRVKLIDFGIVHDRSAVASPEGGTRRGALVGTPGYMALEQYGAAGSVTPAADVFALAVIIWEMFCGDRPWSASNEYELYEKQRTQAPVLPPGNHLPPSWEPILRAALSPTPTDRPALHVLLYALGRDIPAEPPEPDGIQMMTRYAPRVLMNVPLDMETVRASNPQQASAALWALQRQTVVPQSGSGNPWYSSDAIRLTAPGFTPPSQAIVSAPHVMPSDAPATVNARPAPAVVPAPVITTIGASSGVVVPQPQPSRVLRGGRLALVGIGSAVLAVGLTVALTRLHGSGSSHAASQSTAPADAAVTVNAPEGAQREAAVPLDAAPLQPGDETAKAAVPEDAVDAAVDTPTTKTPHRPTRTRSTKRPSAPRDSDATTAPPRTNTHESGSATPRKYDPNLPLGEE